MGYLALVFTLLIVGLIAMNVRVRFKRKKVQPFRVATRNDMVHAEVVEQERSSKSEARRLAVLRSKKTAKKKSNRRK